jgi:DNA-binding GntR family transcriptional regulator
MSPIKLDDYVLDTLMADLVGHDRQPSAFLVYLLLWRQTHGSGRSAAQVSLQDLSLGTGLSKRSVQEALRWLSKRRLLSLQRESITAIPVYTVRRPWARDRTGSL